ALRVPTMDLAEIRAAHVGDGRLRDYARRHSGAVDRGNALTERAYKGEPVRRIEPEVHRERIEAAQRARERERIEVESVACTDDGLLVQTVGHSNARRELLVVDRHADVRRNVAPSTQKYLVRLRIQPLDALACRAAHQRIELITQAEVQRELASDLPAIARVPAELPLARRHQDVLNALLHLIRGAKQERGDTIEMVRRARRSERRW